MPHQQSESLEKLAQQAAISVAGILLEAFRSEIAVEEKSSFHDVVTIFDRQAEQIIRQQLLEGYPNSTVIGEEAAAEGGGTEVVWYVDPIDGTSNFSRGIAYWCVSIAATIDEKVVAGVVYDPVAKNLFSANLNHATLNGEVISSRAMPSTKQATLLTSYPAMQDLERLGSDAFKYHEELIKDFRHVHSLGSGALNLVHVAAGWSDATMGFSTCAWDVAAGSFILEQAGGSFYGFTNGTPSTPAFLAKDYYAVGANSDYPELSRGLIELSAAHPSERV